MTKGISLTFNRDTSINATEDREWNTLFLKSNIVYMQDLLKIRGYIYFNQICEILGIAWDPKQNNYCFLQDDDNTVEFSIIFGTELTVIINHKY